MVRVHGQKLCLQNANTNANIPTKPTEKYSGKKSQEIN